MPGYADGMLLSDTETGTQRLRADHRRTRVQHWDHVAAKPRWTLGGYYHRQLQALHGFLVPPDMAVLEVGCGTGDLLAALKPRRGVGLDVSAVALDQARIRHPQLEFIQADAHDPPLTGTFDYIVLSDLVDDLWNVETVLRRLQPHCHPGTRLIITCFNRLWQVPLACARRLGLARPMLAQNWLSAGDVRNLLYLSGFEVVRDWREMPLPLGIPLLAPLVNRVLGRWWPLRGLGIAQVFVARPQATPRPPQRVSVIVPARNEAGTIRDIVARVPEMGAGTELIFVEGGSSDGTAEEIARCIAEHPERSMKLLRQSGRGKADAVRCGFAAATGDLLMILDADMAVAPEDLASFHEALRSGRGEYVNGVRLVYPLAPSAMRFFNLLGNKFFAAVLSMILGQRLGDTLCGTKALARADYLRLEAGRAFFGDFDPFGDFDLILGAAKLNLRMVDVPVRYHARVYGETNIQRWRHGLILLRMAWFAARRLAMR